MAQNVIERAVNRAWWGLVLRGIIAIALGVFILARPLESVAAFALVVAIWALVDGLTNVVHSFDLKPYLSQWWLMLTGQVDANSATAFALVSSGYGWALLPTTARPALPPTLRYLSLTDVAIPLETHLITRADDRSTRSRVFRRIVQSLAPNP